jgi:signal recognition particle receptor subunit beta
MPFIDSGRQLLVVRVVYDGPPMSGKTTTLRSLARRLGSPEVNSPAEADGRTTFFDWTEYVGGLYEGRQIRCQIVSVPGQVELRHRRAFLLQSADAVVFVADTRATALPRSLAMLEELAPHCRGQQPPLGIVFQANKRDDEEALPAPVLRRMLAAISPMVLVETVATDGDGVREAFVLAVRLALDRVRPFLTLAGAGEPGLAAAGPDELLNQLLGLERAAPASGAASEARSLLAQLPSSAAAEANTAMVSTFVPGSEKEKVFVPNLMMPGGRIWPPVDGRALLHEVNALGLTPVRTSTGDWWAAGGGWWVHSTANAIYDDLDAARRQLIECARVHRALGDHLSADRVLILADAGRERQRIWQLVRANLSLHGRLGAIAGAPLPEFADELCVIARHLLEARALFSTTSPRLDCTLETVGGEPGQRPRFVGLMAIHPETALPELNDAELLTSEFGPALTHLLRRRDDGAELSRYLDSKQRGDIASRTLTQLVGSRLTPTAARAG